MVDTGLDSDTAKKALRALEGAGATLAAIAITHGHADHFGGAGWLAEKTAVAVYAPPLEAPFIMHPLLEPLLLYSGAAPIAELQGKFTLAKQSVSHVTPLPEGAQEIGGVPASVVPLPGHAPAQAGIAFGDTLFCGDAVFPEATLARHPILFCADLDAWLGTLAQLPALPYRRVVPGHGEPVEEVAPLAEANAARLQEIRALTWEALQEPKTDHDILRAVAEHYEVTFEAPTFFLLALTTIRAALTSLQRAGEAGIRMGDNRMVWRRM